MIMIWLIYGWNRLDCNSSAVSNVKFGQLRIRTFSARCEIAVSAFDVKVGVEVSLEVEARSSGIRTEVALVAVLLLFRRKGMH